MITSTNYEKGKKNLEILFLFLLEKKHITFFTKEKDRKFHRKKENAYIQKNTPKNQTFGIIFIIFFLKKIWSMNTHGTTIKKERITSRSGSLCTKKKINQSMSLVVCVCQSVSPFFLLIIIKNHRVFVFAITIYKYTFKL